MEDLVAAIEYFEDPSGESRESARKVIEALSDASPDDIDVNLYRDSISTVLRAIRTRGWCLTKSSDSPAIEVPNEVWELVN